MATSRYPVLYQINSRVWLTELSQKLGGAAPLDDVPERRVRKLVSKKTAIGKGFGGENRRWEVSACTVQAAMKTVEFSVRSRPCADSERDGDLSV